MEEINKAKLELLEAAQAVIDEQVSVNEHPTWTAIFTTMFLNSGDTSDTGKEVNTKVVNLLATMKEKGKL